MASRISGCSVRGTTASRGRDTGVGGWTVGAGMAGRWSDPVQGFLFSLMRDLRAVDYGVMAQFTGI